MVFTNKAQVQTFETIGVLLVFFMLLIVSAVFYMNYQKAQFKLEKEQKTVLASTEIASKSFLMPEFDCSIVGVKLPNCYDKFKLRAFEFLTKNQEQARTYYFNLFGFATLAVVDVYDPGFALTLYESKPLGKEPKKNVYRTAACLLNPISGACSFGIVEVITYVERE